MADQDDPPQSSPASAAPAPADVTVKILDDAQAALDAAREKAESSPGVGADHVNKRLDLYQGEIKKLREDLDSGRYLRVADLTEEQRQVLFATRPENRPTFLGFIHKILHDDWQ